MLPQIQRLIKWCVIGLDNQSHVSPRSDPCRFALPVWFWSLAVTDTPSMPKTWFLPKNRLPASLITPFLLFGSKCVWFVVKVSHIPGWIQIEFRLLNLARIHKKVARVWTKFWKIVRIQLVLRLKLD